MAQAQDIRSNGREKILEVSIRLFAEFGFEGVAMRQIAKEAGITIPAIYHHFGNKEALYRAVEMHLYSKHAEVLLEVLHSDADPEEKLRAFITNLAERLILAPNYLKIMQRDLIEGNAENHRFLVEMSIQGVFDELRLLIDQCAKGSGKGVQPIFLFSAILGFLTMRPVTSRIAGYEFARKDERAQLDELVDVLMRTVGH
jgi:AcrR family transcriptional regulator